MATLNKDKLYEQFANGDFSPLIMYLLNKKQIAQEDFNFESFERELKKIKGPTDTIKFTNNLLECLEIAVERQMYTECAGRYFPRPYTLPRAKITFE